MNRVRHLGSPNLWFYFGGKLGSSQTVPFLGHHSGGNPPNRMEGVKSAELNDGICANPRNNPKESSAQRAPGSDRKPQVSWFDHRLGACGGCLRIKGQ